MNLSPTRDSPDKLDLRPSFRKTSNDGAHRKYRHHSPVDDPDSSSSIGSPKDEQGTIRVNSLEKRNQVFDERSSKYHCKEPERDHGRSHSSRGNDRHRYPGNCRSSRDYPHNDERGGYRRLDDDDRNSIRYSGHEIRTGRSDRARHDSSFERSKESHNTDRNLYRYNSIDKLENSGPGSRGKDREASNPDNRYNENESSRASGSRRLASRRDNKRVDELDRPRERDDRDDKRIRHRSPNDYRKEIAPVPQDTRRHTKDSFIEEENINYRLKESQLDEIDEQDYHVHRRRHGEKDNKKHGNKYSLDSDENRKDNDSFSFYKGREQKRESCADKNSNASKELSSPKKSKIGQPDKFSLNLSGGKPSSSEQVNEATDKLTVGFPVSASNLTESGQDLTAAKVAAMQAAELVNKNLVGTGFMSTDQKKKLLWGNKKSTSDESGTRWDLQLFEDRERQEKFNKLMGVKGEAIPPERKPDEKDVEKQKELQMDLEKQYTAGLRRRDGRTVGLGL